MFLQEFGLLPLEVVVQYQSFGEVPSHPVAYHVSSVDPIICLHVSCSVVLNLVHNVDKLVRRELVRAFCRIVL